MLAPDHDLVLVARSAAKLDALATELGGARVIAADLSDPGGVAKIVAEVPDVDVLVNNAGVGDFGAFAERRSRPDARDDPAEHHVAHRARPASTCPGCSSAGTAG